MFVLWWVCTEEAEKGGFLQIKNLIFTAEKWCKTEKKERERQAEEDEEKEEEEEEVWKEREMGEGRKVMGKLFYLD